MESLLNRYRNITVLLLVIFAQLVLLAVQVKNDRDVPLMRVWAVSAVMPVARAAEMLRGSSLGLVRNYILLRDANDENRKLQEELGRLKLENNFLKNELNTADRAKALSVFQAHTASKTLAANVIGTSAGPDSKLVFVDRGSVAGVERGMAVLTPDGIVGKIVAAYPTASEVLLITDPDFAAGVIGQTSQARGTLKGNGTPVCKVDYVTADKKVKGGEWFYTSGDDRIFPRGFPVGVVQSVRRAQPFQEILLEPSGLQHGLDDVLIVLEGVHQKIPENAVAGGPVYMAPPAPGSQPADEQANSQPNNPGTEADKLRARYKAIGQAEGHTFGEGLPGSKPPDFNIKLPPGGSAALAGAGNQPSATGQTTKQPAASPPAASQATKQPAASVPAASQPPKQPASPLPAAGAPATPPVSTPAPAANSNQTPAPSAPARRGPAGDVTQRPNSETAPATAPPSGQPSPPQPQNISPIRRPTAPSAPPPPKSQSPNEL
jgi:rod shape-determining protein MreC